MDIDSKVIPIVFGAATGVGFAVTKAVTNSIAQKLSNDNKYKRFIKDKYDFSAEDVIEDAIKMIAASDDSYSEEDAISTDETNKENNEVDAEANTVEAKNNVVQMPVKSNSEKVEKVEAEEIPPQNNTQGQSVYVSTNQPVFVQQPPYQGNPNPVFQQ